MKDNTHFINLRDSMMVSLQDFLKYHQSIPSHIISSKKILPNYSIWSEQIVPENMELQ